MERRDDGGGQAEQAEREREDDPHGRERAHQCVRRMRSDQLVRNDDGTDHDGECGDDRADPVTAGGDEFLLPAIDVGAELAQFRWGDGGEPLAVAVVAAALCPADAEVEQQAADQERGTGDGGGDGEVVGQTDECKHGDGERGERHEGQPGTQRCMLEPFIEISRFPRHHRSSPP